MRAPSRKRIGIELISMGRHLVYAEGTKTEPQYVEKISEHLKPDPTRRNLLIPKKYSKTKHTLELIERAENDVSKERKANKSIDGVWILFDKDSFDDFNEACLEIEKKNCKKNSDGQMADDFGTVWHCCYSNESFELWPYLHFEDLTTPLDRNVYIEKIDAFIKSRGFKGEYKKNERRPYDFLINNGGDVDKAIKFAKRKNPGVGKTKPNPSTSIYELVEFFKAYFSK